MSDWTDIDEGLPEEGAFAVTASDFDNTGNPIYDLIQVTAHVLECMDLNTTTTDPDVGFSHWLELTPPDFNG